MFLLDLQEKQRADERTRTAYPCSLRVITQALQGVAQLCKSPIPKRLSLLGVAVCCTVLRSRWVSEWRQPTANCVPSGASSLYHLMATYRIATLLIIVYANQFDQHALGAPSEQEPVSCRSMH